VHPGDTKEFINMSNTPLGRPCEALYRRMPTRDGLRGKDFNMRWSRPWWLTAPHPVTRRRVFFCTPGTSASPTSQQLRLMYEANPLSWLIEQPGGASTNGRVNAFWTSSGQTARTRQRRWLQE
jgi:fructose-1,6-bisphosphatase I